MQKSLLEMVKIWKNFISEFRELCGVPITVETLLINFRINQFTNGFAYCRDNSGQRDYKKKRINSLQYLTRTGVMEQPKVVFSPENHF